MYSRENQSIAQYNKDLKGMGGYIYTGNQKRKSMDIFNERASLAIASLVKVENRSVIDIGCGDGTFSAELFVRMKARRVVGVDPSNAWKKATETNARWAPHVQFQQGNVSHLDFPDNSFDVAMMRGVLHHLDDPRAGLREMFRVARDVFLLEPNGYNPIVKLIEKLSPYHRAHGERSYRPLLIRSWMRASGGQFVGESYSSLVPLFCPDLIADFLNWLSPKWERLPLLPKATCGLYCALFTRQA
ncbi:MAG: class I SAM-dependent methyltransferase [Kiritimatiellae bacterium]|nr:class I SAM-dependent methyltransferase [Kiritimatiellia bacterium]